MGKMEDPLMDLLEGRTYDGPAPAKKSKAKKDEPEEVEEEDDDDGDDSDEPEPERKASSKNGGTTLTIKHLFKPASGKRTKAAPATEKERTAEGT